MPVVEQQLYDRYLFAVNTGEWGPYEALTPTEKMVIFLRWLRGCCVGKKWSYGVVYFDLGGGGMQINHFVFQPPRHLHTMSLGGYCRL